MTGKISLHEMFKNPSSCLTTVKGKEKKVFPFPLNPSNNIILNSDSNHPGRLKTGNPEIHLKLRCL